MSRKFLIIGLIIPLCFLLTLTAYAAKSGSVSLNLPDVVGAEFSLYHIATVDVNSYGNLNYTFTKEFENCQIPLDDKNALSKLDSFISNQSAFKMTTDANGSAVCNNLPLGLYFVKQTNTVAGFAPCKPFFVSVPNDDFVYDVDASPKTEAQALIPITIKKVWNTDQLAKTPDSVTVELLRDGVAIKTAILNAQNNWQITFENMPKSDTYSIIETNVPKGFAATYSQNEYEYIVTNTASLIQTGQLMWPIPALAVSGLALLALGFVLLQKRGVQMRRFIGAFCIFLGIICLVGAVGFVLYNRQQAKDAGQFSELILQQVKNEIKESAPQPTDKMPTASALGYDSIGVLSIPSLNLELPVLTDWSYEKLKKAPCLYYGSYLSRIVAMSFCEPRS